MSNPAMFPLPCVPRLLVFVAFLVASVFVSAQSTPHYDVSFTMGTWESTSPTHPTISGTFVGGYVTPYGTSWAYGRNPGAGYVDPGYGTARIDGPVTATLTWSGPVGTEPPFVVVREISEAIWYGTDGGGTVGLPIPTPYTNQSYINTYIQDGKVQGQEKVLTRYVVKHGRTIVLDPRDIHANCSEEPPGSYFGGVASAYYLVTPYPTNIKVAVTPRVQALGWDDTNHVQNASFSCSESFNPLPPSWSYTGCDWTSDGGANLVIDSPQSPSTTIHARAPGQFKLAGTAHLTTADGSHVDVPAVDYCAAFGGPLMFKAVPVSGITAKNLVPWTNDLGDETKPYYLQYFYKHDATLSRTMQRQQTGSVEIHGQPVGTTMTWSLPAFLYTADPTTVSATDSLINVTADNVGTGLVTCAFAVHWLDPTASAATGNPSYVDAMENDDTGSSKGKSSSDNRSGPRYVPLVNQFHAHAPGRLTWVATGPMYVPAGVPPGGCGAETDYTMILFDSEEEAMPGVWVQERFKPDPPPWFTTNFNDPIQPAYWTSTRMMGELNKPDHVRKTWDDPSREIWQNWSFFHEYWAASSDATSGQTEGIEVGQATMTFVPSSGSTSASAEQTPPLPPSAP